MQTFHAPLAECKAWHPCRQALHSQAALHHPMLSPKSEQGNCKVWESTRYKFWMDLRIQYLLVNEITEERNMIKKYIKKLKHEANRKIWWGTGSLPYQIINLPHLEMMHFKFKSWDWKKKYQICGGCKLIFFFLRSTSFLL